MNRKIFRFITLFFVFGLSIMVAGCGDGSYTAKNKFVGYETAVLVNKYS